jgi:hypothetical protein
MDLGNIPVRTKRPLEYQTLSTGSHTTGHAALTIHSKRKVEAYTPSTQSAGITGIPLAIRSKRLLDNSKDTPISQFISPSPDQDRAIKRVKFPDSRPPVEDVMFFPGLPSTLAGPKQATRPRKKNNHRRRTIWSSAPGINPFIRSRDARAPSPEPAAQTTKNHTDRYTREEIHELTERLTKGPAPRNARQLSFWHRILSIEDAAPSRAQGGLPYGSPGSYGPYLETPVQTTKTRDDAYETRNGPQIFSWRAFTSPIPNDESIREHHELPDDEYRLSRIQRELLFQTADSYPPEYESTTPNEARSMLSPEENAVERKQLRDLDLLFDERETPASVKWEVLAELPNIVEEHAGKEMMHDEDNRGEGKIRGEKLWKMNEIEAENRIDDDDEDEYVDINDMEVDENEGLSGRGIKKGNRFVTPDWLLDIFGTPWHFGTFLPGCERRTVREEERRVESLGACFRELSCDELK